MKIIPVAPYIPELTPITLEHYLQSVDTHLSKLPTIEKNQTLSEVLKVRLQQALEIGHSESMKPAEKVWENIREGFQRILDSQRSNPDFATIIDAYIFHVCSEYLAAPDADPSVADIVLDVVQEWNEICQKYNIIYVNNEKINDEAKDFLQNIDVDLYGRKFGIKHKLLNLGYLATVVGLNLGGKVFLGQTPSALDITTETLNSAKDLGLFDGFFRSIGRLASKFFQKITTSLGTPKSISLQNHSKTLQEIDESLIKGYEFMETGDYKAAKSQFEDAFKQAKTLTKKKIQP